MNENAATQRLVSHLGYRLYEFIVGARNIPALEQNTRDAIANDRAMCHALDIDWRAVTASCRMMVNSDWPEFAWLDG